jgi:hypothetical protein
MAQLAKKFEVSQIIMRGVLQKLKVDGMVRFVDGKWFATIDTQR